MLRLSVDRSVQFRHFFVKSHHDFEVQVTCIKIGQSGVTYPTATDREWRRGKSKHSGFPTFYILHFRRIGRLFPIRDPVISRRRSGIIDFLGTHWVLPRIFQNFAFNIFLCPGSSALGWLVFIF